MGKEGFEMIDIRDKTDKCQVWKTDKNHWIYRHGPRILKVNHTHTMTTSKITTIAELRKSLRQPPGPHGYSALVDTIDLPVNEIAPYTQWNKDHHTRISLYDSPDIEAVLTCWEPGQSSAIHDYDFKQGWACVLQGDLYLELYHILAGRPVEFSELSLHDQNVFYLNDAMGFHRFSNNSPNRTIALFLYASKVQQWTTYDEKTGEFITEHTGYDHSYTAK